VFTIIGVTRKNFFGPIVGKAPEVTFPVKMDGGARRRERHREARLQLALRYGAVETRGQPEEAQTEVSGLFRRRLELEASKVELRDKKRSWINESNYGRRETASRIFDLSERYAEPLLALMAWLRWCC